MITVRHPTKPALRGERHEFGLYRWPDTRQHYELGMEENDGLAGIQSFLPRFDRLGPALNPRNVQAVCKRINCRKIATA
jgi:hypothetical protein